MILTVVVMIIAGVEIDAIDKADNPEYYKAMEQCRIENQHLRRTHLHYGNHEKYINIGQKKHGN
jgi:hypothetical protein